jgi:hypothetical protein
MVSVSGAALRALLYAMSRVLVLVLYAVLVLKAAWACASPTC